MTFEKQVQSNNRHQVIKQASAKALNLAKLVQKFLPNSEAEIQVLNDLAKKFSEIPTSGQGNGRLFIRTEGDVDDIRNYDHVETVTAASREHAIKLAIADAQKICTKPLDLVRRHCKSSQWGAFQLRCKGPGWYNTVQYGWTSFGSDKIEDFTEEVYNQMLKPATITVYRIENEAGGHGMWYRADGTYDPFIKTLPNAKSADLPMEPDERYGQNGKRWYSSAPSIELMNHWFTAEDARNLAAAGYLLFEYEVSEYIVEEFQVIFTRESVVKKTLVPLESVWS